MRSLKENHPGCACFISLLIMLLINKVTQSVCRYNAGSHQFKFSPLTLFNWCLEVTNLDLSLIDKHAFPSAAEL